MSVTKKARSLTHADLDKMAASMRAKIKTRLSQLKDRERELKKELSEVADLMYPFDETRTRISRPDGGSTPFSRARRA